MKRIQLLCFLLLCTMMALGAPAQLQQRKPYTLHPGDVLELSYRITPELDQTVSIEPDGYASLNIAGRVTLEGLTMDQAKGRILDRLGDRLKKPELNLMLKDFHKSYVIVGGEVQSPEKLELRDDMTALQALLLAGGVKPSGRSTSVVLFRHINHDDGEIFLLNLGNPRGMKKRLADLREKDNPHLEDGDMLLVTPNRVETFSRYMKAVNFGTFLSPTAF